MLAATVVRVIDGDTVEAVLGGSPIRIRLNGIDAPEKSQPWGIAARRALSKMVLRREVKLEPFEQDAYGRLVATVLLDGHDVNGEMIEEGHAWAFRKYLRDPKYCNFEDSARSAKRGLWKLRADQIVAPWEWRHRNQRVAFTDFSGESVAHCVAAMAKHGDDKPQPPGPAGLGRE